MAADICPTVTVKNSTDYQLAIGHLSRFALRLHIDLADATLTPNRLIDPDKVWWPGGMRADLHVMYKRPMGHIDTFVALGPQLIIIHAEADGDFPSLANFLHRHGIEVGVALMPETQVDLIGPSLGLIDHVLIFSGKIGYYGGQADLSLLSKVKRLKELKPSLEIGWDGGINDVNIKQLIDGGVEVLNVGGYIHGAANPDAAYAKLLDEIPK